MTPVYVRIHTGVLFAFIRVEDYEFASVYIAAFSRLARVHFCKAQSLTANSTLRLSRKIVGDKLSLAHKIQPEKSS